MIVDLLRHIPMIHVEEPQDGTLVITTDDGFKLKVHRVQRKSDSDAPVDFWAFGTWDAITRAGHFHLRQLIDAALNPKKVKK